MIEKHSWHFTAVGVPAEKGLMIHTKVFPSEIWPLLKTPGISLFPTAFLSSLIHSVFCLKPHSS